MKNLNLGWLLSALMILPACSDKRAVGGEVSQGLVITASAQSSALAWSPIDSLMNLLFPSAIALLPSSIVDANGVSVVLSQAWIVIEEIQLEAETEDGAEEEENEIEFKGPYYVDLLADDPALVDSSLLADVAYNRIEMKLHRMEDPEDEDVGAIPAGVPAGLVDQSIFVEGSIGGRSFKFATPEETEFEVRNEYGVTPSSLTPMVVALRLADLMAQIDLSSVVDGAVISAESRIVVEGACPLIDASANDLYTCFRKGLEQSSRFGRDHDGDDDLDDDEFDGESEDESNDD